jgi:LCP family protein required for cell wall assembly
MPSRYSGIDPKSLHYPPKPKKKTSILELLLFGVFAVLIIVGGLALYQQFSPNKDYIPSTVAEGFKRDRVNLLLIGIAGERKLNGGNDLADAIILVSVKPSTKQAALVSIPRDLYLPVGRFGPHRLNAAHDLGYKMGYRGGGPGLLMDTVASITGQPIDGYARIDFKAFAKIIDDVGGVDIFVYRPFHDYLFKDTFEQGWQHMNGDRALRYARYRYVRGAEGNNFARELRQQQVISAVKKKLAHLTVAQMLSLVGSATTVSKFTKTNLGTGDMIQLYRTFHDLPSEGIRHVSLAPLTEVFMVTKIDDSGEAVRPPGDSYAGIQAMARDVFKDTRPLVNRDQIQLSDTDKPKPSDIVGDDTLREPPKTKSQMAP